MREVSLVFASCVLADFALLALVCSQYLVSTHRPVRIPSRARDAAARTKRKPTTNEVALHKCSITVHQRSLDHDTEPTHFRRDREHQTDGDIGRVPAHANKHSLEVCATSGKSLRFGFNVATADSRAGVETSAHSNSPGQANDGYSSEQAE